MESINVSEAARRKQCSHSTIKYALFKKWINGTTQAGRTIIFLDEAWRNWQPDNRRAHKKKPPPEEKTGGFAKVVFWKDGKRIEKRI